MNNLYSHLSIFRFTLLCSLLAFGCSTTLVAQELSTSGLQTINYSGSATDYIIPEDVTDNLIRFTIKGGSGGYAALGSCKSNGGEGATVTGAIPIGTGEGQIPPGSEIRFIVGESGEANDLPGEFAWASGAGGGGSALLARFPGDTESDDWIILAVAGGGGAAYQGAVIFCVDSQAGQGGRATTSGGDGAGDFAGNGGSNGDGGDGGGEIGDGDLSGGGGGAFSDGSGPASTKGKTGYPSGGNGGNGAFYNVDGGWGFGGGGAPDETPGGGGGYSGGGGAGNLNNGGGGGSYVNSDYTVDTEITAGGTTGSLDDGTATYEFESICSADITGFTYVNPICTEDGTGWIQLTYDFVGGNVCDSEIEFNLSPYDTWNNDGDGNFKNLRVGTWTASVINTTYDIVMQTFTIETEVSDVAPVAICRDRTVTLNSSGNYSWTNFANWINDGSYGDCDSPLTLSVSENTFDCDDVGEKLVTLTVTGSNGVTDQCESTITVQPDDSPNALCQSTKTIDLNGESAITLSTDDIDDGSNLGSCSYPEGISISPTTFDCDDIGANTVTLTVQGRDNSATCTTVVNITDNNLPTALCKTPDPISLDDNGSATISETDIDDGSYVDNCTSLTYILSESSFNCGDVGDHEVTLTVRDGYNNTANCTVTVTIVDDSDPVLICQDITVALDEDGIATIETTELLNSAFDNCTFSYSASKTSFDCDEIGSQAVTLIATDLQGNEGTCTSTVTVEDNTPPTAVCIDFTLSLTGPLNLNSSQYNVYFGSTDNCSWTASVVGESFLTCDDLGENEITYEITDPQGNTSTCVSIITLEDNTAPSARCEDVTVQLDDTGNASVSAELIGGASGDYCSISSLSLSATDFDCTHIGENTVTLTATDQSGNSSTCEATVTIEDNTAPEANCTDLTIDLIDENTYQLSNTDLATITASSSDNCGIANTTVDAGTTSYDCDDVGTSFTLSLNVSDDSGNSSTCTAQVTVADPNSVCNDAPVAVDDEATTSEDTPVDIPVEANDSDAEDVTMDPCDVTIISQPAHGTVTISGASDCTLTYTPDTDFNGEDCFTYEICDSGGLCDQAEVCVNVDPVNDAPVAVCQDLNVFADGNCEAVIMAVEFDFGSSDTEDDDLTFTLSPEGPYSVGTTEVTLTVTDAEGASDQCAAIVSVVDNTNPTAICQDITIQLDANGNASISESDIDNASNDACGIASLSLDNTTFDCADVGPNTVSLTVTDAAGNTAICSSTVTVVDEETPTVVTQDITVQIDVNGSTSITAADVDNGSSDNCGIASLVISPSTFGCTDVGVNTVTLTATDVNGNVTSGTAIVTIADNIAPTLTCPGDMIVNTDAGECGAYVSLPKAAPFDNCGIKNLKSRYRAIGEEGTPIGAWSSWDGDQSGFFGQGFYQIQWRAKDNANNKGFCSFTLEVKDEEAPEVSCQDITISFNGEENIAISSTSIFNQTASFDACGEVTFVSQSLSEVNCEDVGEILVVEVVGADPHGNTSTCTSLVTVEGLPCDFETIDIDCPDGASGDYDATDESFTLTANDCIGYPQGAFSWLGSRLCGDGEIVAEVTSLSGDARVGVVMMESQEHGARLVSIVKDFTPRVRTEYRSTTGGSLSHKSKNRTGVDWLRIVRTGNKFKTYTSTNGSYWRLAHTINFSNFEDCIYVGLMLYNKSGGEPVTATFENVKITGESGEALNQQPSIPASTVTEARGQSMELAAQSGLQLEAFPNPFSELLTIRYATAKAGQVDLAVFNLQGQLVRMLYQGQADRGEQQLQQWDGTDTSGNPLPAGMYLIQMKTGDEVVNQKVLLQAN